MQIFGSKAAVRIKGDPSAMAARGIAVDDLASAIKGGTSTVGAGQFDAPSGTLLLSPHGQLDKAEAYDDLIVGTRNGAPVHLRDVAKASDSVQDERVRIAFWVKGHPVPGSAVVVALLRQAGANAVAVAKSVRDVLPSINQELPGLCASI